MCFCAETIEIWKTEAFKFQKEEEAEQKCSPKKWSQRKEGRLGQKKKNWRLDKRLWKSGEILEFWDAWRQVPGDAEDSLCVRSSRVKALSLLDLEWINAGIQMQQGLSFPASPVTAAWLGSPGERTFALTASSYSRSWAYACGSSDAGSASISLLANGRSLRYFYFCFSKNA